MIKIIDSGYGVRLSYEDKDVFNHTALVPFIKSVKCKEKFFVKDKKILARFDVDGEFSLPEVRVASCSIKSAHVDFSGYDGAIKISVVEEENRLALHFSDAPFDSMKLTFLTPTGQTIKFSDKEISGGVSDNLCSASATIFDKIKGGLKDKIHFENECSLVLPDGRRYVFDTDGLVTVDYTKKALVFVYFQHIPKTIYFYKV